MRMNKCKKLIVTVVLATMAGAMLTGCSKSKAEESKWSKVAKPKIEYVKTDEAGAKIFDEMFPDATEFMQGVCEEVVDILYNEPDEVRKVDKITFTIDGHDGVANKTGNGSEVNINLSAKYMENFKKSGGDLKDEIRGVMIHEMTHVYQNDSGLEMWVIDGVADLVRYLSGHVPLAARNPGGKYRDSYKTTAFFFDWIAAKNSEKYDFLYELNKSASKDNKGYWSFDKQWMEITETKIDDLWAEYQKDLKTKGFEAPTSCKKDNAKIPDGYKRNLATGKDVLADSNVDNETPEMAVDGKSKDLGTGGSKWCSTVPGDRWLQIDLEKPEKISRWVVRHAASNGERKEWNTKDFKLQKSDDGKTWTDVDVVTGNTENVTDRKVETFESRYVRLYITAPTSDGNDAVRIYEVELY